MFLLSFWLVFGVVAQKLLDWCVLLVIRSLLLSTWMWAQGVEEHGVKVLANLQSPYRSLPPDFEQRFDSVVTTPYHDVVDPARVPDVYRWSIDEFLHAARLGFDGVVANITNWLRRKTDVTERTPAAWERHTGQSIWQNIAIGKAAGSPYRSFFALLRKRTPGEPRPKSMSVN